MHKHFHFIAIIFALNTFLTSSTVSYISDLQSLQTNLGFRIQDSTLNSDFGTNNNVNSAGDCNNDGIPDFTIRADAASPFARTSAGITYVVYGTGKDSANMDIASLTWKTGMQVYGANGGDGNGFITKNIGDINGDGFDDLATASKTANGDTGIVYVIFGSPKRHVNIDLYYLNAQTTQTGFRVLGANGGNEIGWGITSVGDMNGDGLGDFAFGSYNTGLGYVIYGRRGINSDSDIDLSVSSSQYIMISGVGCNLGMIINPAGDLNQDGVDDLLITAYGCNNVYVIYGDRGQNNIDLSVWPNQAQGFQLTDSTGSSFGSAAGVLDYNKDGTLDLLIGDQAANGGDGVSWVVFTPTGGTSSWGASPIDVSTLGTSQAILITGADAGGNLGYAMTGVPDINGDGIDDVLIGAPFGSNGAGRTNNGAIYFLFGTANPVNIDLSTMTITQGFKVIGERTNDGLGSWVDSIGDVNGDGQNDIIVSAPNDGNHAYYVYILYPSVIYASLTATNSPSSSSNVVAAGISSPSSWSYADSNIVMIVMNCLLWVIFFILIICVIFRIRKEKKLKLALQPVNTNISVNINNLGINTGGPFFPQYQNLQEYSPSRSPESTFSVNQGIPLSPSSPKSAIQSANFAHNRALQRQAKKLSTLMQ